MPRPRLDAAVAAVRDRGAPRALFDRHPVTLWRKRDSKTGKYHRSDSCYWSQNTSSWQMHTVPVHPAELRRSRLCSCLEFQDAPDELLPVLEAVLLVTGLAGRARELADADPDAPVDLTAAEALTAGLDALPTARTLLLTDAAAAGPDVSAAVTAWLEQASDAARTAQAALAGRLAPDRAVRAAAWITGPDLSKDADAADAVRYPCLYEQATLHPALYPPLWQALHTAVLTPTQAAARRAELLAVLDELAPTRLAQLPPVTMQDIPAGTPLLDAVTHAWRAVARTQLGALFDELRLAYEQQATDTTPTLLLITDTLEPEPAALVAGYPAADAGPTSDYESIRAYLVPAVVGRAVATLDWHPVLLSGAPVPDRYADDPARVLDSDYLRVLLRLIDDEMGTDDAVTAALAVTTPTPDHSTT